MSSSTKTRLADKPAATTIADLFSKCSEIADKEERELGRMVGVMTPVLAWLDAPVALRPESLGEAFTGFASVSLQAGPTVVTTDPAGKVVAMPLATLPTRDSMAVIREAFPELQRVVAERRRASQARPALSVKASLRGTHLVLDTRTWRLLVTNSGGDCRRLRISTLVPDGITKVTKPFDLGRGLRAEVDLGMFKEVGAGLLNVQIECEDADGRQLKGEETVGLEGADWHEAVLSEKQSELSSP